MGEGVINRDSIIVLYLFVIGNEHVESLIWSKVFFDWINVIVELLTHIVWSLEP